MCVFCSDRSGALFRFEPLVIGRSGRAFKSSRNSHLMLFYFQGSRCRLLAPLGLTSLALGYCGFLLGVALIRLNEAFQPSTLLFIVLLFVAHCIILPPFSFNLPQFDTFLIFCILAFSPDSFDAFAVFLCGCHFQISVRLRTYRFIANCQ